MITLRKIILPNGKSQWCLLKGSSQELERIRDAQMVRHNVKSCSSDIFVDLGASIFLKAPPVKSFWKNNLVKLVFWTPADKEYRGNLLLAKLGLQTTQVLARGIPLNPFNSYRSLLYYHFLADAAPLNDFLLSHPNSPQRQDLLDDVAKQMALMFHHGVSFRDFYFGNLLYSSTGNLYWIDAEVQHYWFRKRKPRERFLAKWKYMRARFQRTGGKEEEWDRFSRIILDEDCQVKDEPKLYD